MKRAVVVAIALLAGVFTREAAAQDAPVDSPTDKPEAKPGQARLSVTGSAGADYKRLFDLSMTGLGAQLGVGAEMNDGSIYITGGAFVGATNHGLPAHQITFGVSGGLRAERFTFGSDLRLSAMTFIRATDGTSLTVSGIGLAPFVRYDLVTFDEHALFLDAVFHLDVYGGDSGSLLWGPSLSVGARL